MKTIIIYVSVHHGNTKKVVERMAQSLAADMVDLAKAEEIDFSGYDLSGFASGAYFNSLHKGIKEFISNAQFQKGQRVFLVATCGVNYRDYTKELKKNLAEKGVTCVASFQCRGYDTYGFWEKIGGIAKGRPNSKDLKRAAAFAQSMLQG